MCKSSPECLLQASKFLLTTSPVIEVSSDDDDEHNGNEDNDSKDEQNPTRKRPRPDSIDLSSPNKLKTPKLVSRFETCRICEEKFDISENNDEACATHPGEREMQDAWYDDFDHNDWESDPDVEDDNDWRILEWPQHFPWNCCNQPADAEGCNVQRHEAQS